MFDFIRKPMLWEAWDKGTDKEIGRTPNFHLKTIQDLAVHLQLRGTSGKSIAEIGGGHSRLLEVLSRSNTCVNVEKFEGIAGGPSKEKRIAGVRNISAYLGENDPQLVTASYDIVFSVSVVEHVPSDKLGPFFDDQMRILKPGGLFLHAIDLYLEDEPAQFYRDRFGIYKSWAQKEGVIALGPVFDGPCRFSCDLATNPDDIMYTWGRVAPALIPLRQRAQSVSLLVAGRKA
jgi:SAM-dependent methyltransferase